MKIEQLALFASLAIIAMPGAARAGSEAAGTTAANFLSTGSGTAVLGRGGATLGLSGEAGLSSWNPGALGFLRETQISLSHATLIDEHTQEYLAAGGRMLRSDLRWSAFGLYESEGSFEGRDAFNNSTGSFNVSSFAGGGHLAYPIGGVASIGVGGKWVNESLGANRGAGMAWDAGFQAHTGMFGFGFAAQNAFGKMRFGNQTFDFPTNYGVGVALDHAESGLRIALDANFPTSYYNDVRTGVEWRWRDLVAVRGGYRAALGAPTNETLSGPTFGFGAGVYGMWMDYGYVIPGSGEAQHRFGISLRPGRMSLGGGALGHEESPAAMPSHAPRAEVQRASNEPAASSPPPVVVAQPAPIVVVPEVVPPPATVTSTPVPQASVAPPSAGAPVTKVEVVPAQVSQASDSGTDETPKKKKSKKEKKQKKTKIEKPADDAAAAQEEEESEDPFEAAITRAKKLKPGIRIK